MGRNPESCVAQDVVSIGIELAKKGIPIKQTFGVDDPCYQAVTNPRPNDRRIPNVLKSVLSADGVPKGIEDLTQIRCEYLTTQEQRQQEPWQKQKPKPKQEQTHKKNKHKNKRN